VQLLDYDGLKAKGIPYSRPHLWRLMKKDFPRPVKLGGGGRNLWVEDEVDAYLARKLAERQNAA
jgi:prophage regulatory protein